MEGLALVALTGAGLPERVTREQPLLETLWAEVQQEEEVEQWQIFRSG